MHIAAWGAVTSLHRVIAHEGDVLRYRANPKIAEGKVVWNKIPSLCSRWEVELLLSPEQSATDLLCWERGCSMGPGCGG